MPQPFFLKLKVSENAVNTGYEFPKDRLSSRMPLNIKYL